LVSPASYHHQRY